MITLARGLSKFKCNLHVTLQLLLLHLHMILYGVTGVVCLCIAALVSGHEMLRRCAKTDIPGYGAAPIPGFIDANAASKLVNAGPGLSEAFGPAACVRYEPFVISKLGPLLDAAIVHILFVARSLKV